MKTVKIIIVALLAIALGSNSYAQMHDHSKMASTNIKPIPRSTIAWTDVANTIENKH